MPTGGQAGRWQTITDTTTIESSLVDLKEKGATPQDRRFLHVDCIKRTTAALGVGVETIEPDHHLLNHLQSLDAPGMSSNHRGRRPGARRSEDARRQSAGVSRSFFANNSSASPAEDVLGLAPLTGGRRAVLPSMHGRSFTAPLTRKALRAELRAAAERAVQGVLKVAFCSFLDQLSPRLPPRPSTNPTFTSFLTQTPIMLTKNRVAKNMRTYFEMGTDGHRFLCFQFGIS